jgi:nucleotide-binding universal stress UspA family protein
MYEQVLVPTDGSEAAEAAIDHAVDVASTYDARLHALYVVDASVYSSLEVGVETVVEALTEEGEKAVARVADRARAADVPVETHVVTGTAFPTILEVADDVDADLIVMATHGRRGIERYLLGSVTERVVRKSDVPVMTVRAGPEVGEEAAGQDGGDGTGSAADPDR